MLKGSKLIYDSYVKRFKFKVNWELNQSGILNWNTT